MHRNFAICEKRSRRNVVCADEFSERAGLNARNSAFVYNQSAAERLLAKLVIVVIALAARAVSHAEAVSW